MSDTSEQPDKNGGGGATPQEVSRAIGKTVDGGVTYTDSVSEDLSMANEAA